MVFDRPNDAVTALVAGRVIMQLILMPLEQLWVGFARSVGVEAMYALGVTGLK